MCGCVEGGGGAEEGREAGEGGRLNDSINYCTSAGRTLTTTSLFPFACRPCTHTPITPLGLPPAPPPRDLMERRRRGGGRRGGRGRCTCEAAPNGQFVHRPCNLPLTVEEDPNRQDNVARHSRCQSGPCDGNDFSPFSLRLLKERRRRGTEI